MTRGWIQALGAGAWAALAATTALADDNRGGMVPKTGFAPERGLICTNPSKDRTDYVPHIWCLGEDPDAFGGPGPGPESRLTPVYRHWAGLGEGRAVCDAARAAGGIDEIGLQRARAARGCYTARRFACEPYTLNASDEDRERQSQSCWWGVLAGTAMPAMDALGRRMPRVLTCAGDDCFTINGFRPSWLLILAVGLSTIVITVRLIIAQLTGGGNPVSDALGWTVRVGLVLGVTVALGTGLSDYMWILAGNATFVASELGARMMQHITAQDLIAVPVDMQGPLTPVWHRVADNLALFARGIARGAGMLVGSGVSIFPLGSIGQTMNEFFNTFTEMATGDANALLRFMRMAAAAALVMAGITLIVTYAVTVAEILLHTALAAGMLPLFALGHLAPRWLPTLPNAGRMIAHGAVLLMATGIAAGVCVIVLDAGFNTFMALITSQHAVPSGAPAPGAGSWLQVVQYEGWDFLGWCWPWLEQTLAPDTRYPGWSFNAFTNLMACYARYRDVPWYYFFHNEYGYAIDMDVIGANWLPGVIILAMVGYTCAAILRFASTVATEVSSATTSSGEAGQRLLQSAKTLGSTALGGVKKMMAR